MKNNEIARQAFLGKINGAGVFTMKYNLTIYSIGQCSRGGQTVSVNWVVLQDRQQTFIFYPTEGGQQKVHECYVIKVHIVKHVSFM